MEHYDLGDDGNLCEFKILLSQTMLKDLVRFAEEQGRDIQVDIRMRLARSLERDLENEIAHQILMGPLNDFKETPVVWDHRDV